MSIRELNGKVTKLERQTGALNKHAEVAVITENGKDGYEDFFYMGKQYQVHNEQELEQWAERQHDLYDRDVTVVIDDITDPETEY